jgi:hypothetical protein
MRIVAASLAILALVVGLFSSVGKGQQEPENRKGSRSRFMRQKLEFSRRVLEGLTLEDYQAITKNGRALKTLSEAAEWEVSTIPAIEYVPYTTEFQRLCDELMKGAKAKNIDEATLAYVQLTMSCVKCHKYLRVVTK